MKLTFNPPTDGRVQRYCLKCGQPGVRDCRAGKRRWFECRACGQRQDRALVIDPEAEWWLDGSREYWHKTAGVFARNPEGEYLFFERTAYPLGLTVPAGHVMPGEQPRTAALRELLEETGVRLARVHQVVVADIPGDGCRRGSDAHQWYAFVALVPADCKPHINDEGTRPVWLTLDEALKRQPTFAVRQLIVHHRRALEGV